ncbi:MAG: sigma 54-interacting transcriptional regulator [Ignavibacteriaceae bacterium]|nr:sigma 54-interacting transcriptional regulator [Ignavibacteria bacterium]MBT8391888.1 sigma 54-interacting transcriptional regulator [Ignavibacteria bacterium]NNL20915.1 sigma 54-interacting transcriptional regulator [Ignavibacteriaceae bacterium]
MSILTILWTFAFTACLTIGLIYLFVWFRLRKSKENLLFSLAAIGAAIVGFFELLALNAIDIPSYVIALKYQTLGIFIMLVALIWFVLFYFGTGRKWIVWLFTFIWMFSIIVNFISPNGVVYSEIMELNRLSLPWGEQYTTAKGIDNPLKFISDIPSLLLVIFIVDASIQLVKKGDKRRAFWIGGSSFFFILLAGTHTPLVDAGIIQSPYIISFSFLAIILAMALEISYGVYDSANLSKEVIANERRWKSLWENVQFLVCGVNKDGVINYINSYYLKTTGYRSEEVINKHFNSIISSNSKSAIKTLGEIFQKENNLPNALVSITTKNGEDRKIFWSNVILKDKDGNYDGVVAIGNDITEKINAEDALMKAVEELQEMKDRLEDEVVYLQQEMTSDKFKDIIGESPAINYVLSRVEEVAQSDTTVLLEGETGVGKERIARAIHQKSLRVNQPFVVVNCAALPANILESELFGYEKGAFTGADKQRRGRFELADKGTLFLDEIADLPLEIQPKLLRVLEGGEFERLGGEKTIKVNVRIISATNKVLKDEVYAGSFREDLFYRINIFPVSIPPLRQRSDDVPLLVNEFVKTFSVKHKKQIDQIPQSTLTKLQNYDWPGNIRELMNVIERAVITTKGNKLKLVDQFKTSTKIKEEQEGGLSSLGEVERDHILKVLEACDWKISGGDGAANILNLHPNTLRSKMEKLDIRKSFK